MRRRRKATAFILIVLACAALFSYLYVAYITPLLVDWSGETELKQQLVAIISASRQRTLETADLAAVTHVEVNPYGVNTFLQQEVEPWKVEQSLDLLHDAGVGWIRQQMPWWDIEPLAKGQYVNQFGQNTWDKYDRLVDAARSRGIQILARLDDPPPWARQKDPGDHHGPPDNLEDYGDFVTAFVTHFKGRIKYYQIWNEPNIYPEWGNRPISASDYVGLLKMGYTHVKQADPDAVVVSASLAATDGMPDGTAENDLTYLEEMYGWGASDYFDIMSVMGYGLWSGPNDRRLDRINFSRPRLVREIMVQHGDAQKAIWMAEMGWHAPPPDAPPEETRWGRVTQDEQALYTTKAYERAQREWPWMGVMFYWHFRMAHGDDPNKAMFYWAMLDPDFTPHPVYSAYKQMATQPPVVNFGQHQEDYWALKFDGTWKSVEDRLASAGSYVVSTEPGARLSLTFHGTDLDLVSMRAPEAGRFSVTIDGHADSRVIDLSGPQLAFQQRFPVASGLSSGDHQIVLESLEPDVPVYVDALIVRDDSLGILPLSLTAVGLLGVVVGIGLTLLVHRLRRKPTA